MTSWSRDSLELEKAYQVHCVKGVRFRSFSGRYFPAFRLNAWRYDVSLRIHSECGKIWTRNIPNKDTFNAVVILR